MESFATIVNGQNFLRFVPKFAILDVFLSRGYTSEYALRKKSAYSEFFWPVFSSIKNEYREMLCILGLNTERYRVSLCIQS